MGCLAADVSIFDDEGRGISRQQVAHEARSLDVGFEKAANLELSTYLSWRTRPSSGGPAA